MNASEGEHMKLYGQDNVEAKLPRKCLVDNLKYQSSLEFQLTNN